jgi:hypothetical protein
VLRVKPVTWIVVILCAKNVSHSEKFRKLENPGGNISSKGIYVQGKEIAWRTARMNVLVESVYCLPLGDGYFSQPLGGSALFPHSVEQPF